MTTTGIRRYRLLEVLGRGGFGTVYRAEVLGAAGFTKPVALKVLNAEAKSQEMAARLRDEARVLGMLSHRAIVQVDGLVHVGDRWAVVMEYIEGVNLGQLRSQVHVPVAVALEVIEAVASALAAAWTRSFEGQPLQLLHRDVKPSNIAITSSGTVKLLDFGLARANFAGREAATKQAVLGSMAYMAPERLRLENGHTADVFALGITLVETLTGLVSTRPSTNEDAHRERVERLVAALIKTIRSDELSVLVRRMLAFRPEDRPDAATVERELRAIRQTLDPLWLADWAAATIPDLLARRNEEPDALVGTTLTERISMVEGSGGAHTFLFTEERLRQLPAEVPRRRRGLKGWLIAGCVSLLAGFVACGGLLLTVLMGVGALLGLLTLLGLSTLWQPLIDHAAEASFEQMHERLRDVKSSQARQQMRSLVERGMRQAKDSEFGLIEIIDFRSRFETAVRDNRLTDSEARSLRDAYDRMAD